MERALWPLVLVATFALGLTAGRAIWRESAGAPPEIVARLQQQISTLQARLRVKDTAPTAPGSEAPAPAEPRPGAFDTATRSADRVARVAVVDELAASERAARGGGAPQPQGQPAPSRAAVAAGSPPTVEAALDRFYQYLEALRAPEGRERGQRLRELINELRDMGEAGGKALMQVLTAGSDSDERRAAARLLGSLQIPEALPLLRDVIQRDDDVLLRRAAASGLRQLQTPESVPVMERIVTNSGEDRFVRLSAAYGLAESGKPLGVSGLAQIFEEASGDGRGRAMAFRALSSLNDERPLPFMRQVLTSDAEPGYRLQAIRYVTAQGDRQALPALQAVMQSTTEQASVRDAAAQAYRTLAGR
jgi:HEAT repeat protein